MTVKRPACGLSVSVKCFLVIFAVASLMTMALGQDLARAAANTKSPSSTITQRNGSASLVSHSPNAHITGSEAQRKNIQSFASRPLGFEVNQGQTDSRVKYFAHGNGYTLFLTADGAVISAARMHSADSQMPSVIRMQLLGANQNAPIEGEDLASSYSNYYIGNNPQNWHTHVAQYGRVNYRDVYSGVDMAFHGMQSEESQGTRSKSALEFDFVLAPRADAAQIALQFSGTEKIKADASGDLVLSSNAGDVRLRKPVAYQEKNGSRMPVEARFIVNAKHQVSFALGNYDRSRELVIDPVLGYSTYLGGSAKDDGFGIAVDNAGAVYIAGQTASSGFPPNASTVAPAGGFDGFVTKVNANGTLAFTNYIGGTGNDAASSIAVDANGNIYLAGGTEGGFPVTGDAFQSSFGGGSTDGFVAKFDNTGTVLYSTELGGDGSDLAVAIAVDSSQNVYVTGLTNSPGTTVKFPTTAGALQSSLNGTGNAFISKFSLQGTGNNTLVYSTYLGGSGFDEGNGIAVDSNGNFYVAGDTTSSDFFGSAATGFQVQCGGATNTNCNGGIQDGFVAKIKSDGSALVYGTFLGGSDTDIIKAITVDSTGAAYVTGSTASSDFPKKNAFQTSLPGGATDAFIAKLTPAGDQLVFSTYFGGSATDMGGLGIAVDSSLQNVYVAGGTSSSDIPTPVGPLPSGSSLQGATDAFIAEFKADGSAPVFSTYFGGTGDEDIDGGGIAVDAAGNIYVTGDTGSTANDLPLQSAAQATYGGGSSDAFVAKITGINTPDYSVVATPASVVAGTSGTSTVTLTYLYAFGEDVTLTCSAGLPAGANCSFSPSTLTGGAATSTLTIDAGTSTPAANSTVTITGTSSPGNVVHTTTLALSVQDFSIAATAPAAVVAGASTPSTVTVTPANGFTGDVTFACSGLPSGANCSFAPSPVTGGTGTSTLTISTSASTPAGISTVTVTGTSGIVSHTTTATLTVQAATVPDFTVTAGTISTPTVVAGTSATSAITVAALGGFATNVALTCAVAPVKTLGPACSFNPATITGGSGTATLTITTTAAVASLRTPGSHAAWLYAMSLPFGEVLLFGAGFSERKKLRKKMMRFLFAAALFCGLMLLAGCGNSKSSTGGTGGGGGGTPGPSGQYTVTVTGTAGTTVHTTTVTVNVQ